MKNTIKDALILFAITLVAGSRAITTHAIMFDVVSFDLMCGLEDTFINLSTAMPPIFSSLPVISFAWT